MRYAVFWVGSGIPKARTIMSKTPKGVGITIFEASNMRSFSNEKFASNQRGLVIRETLYTQVLCGEWCGVRALKTREERHSP